jgi:hypothetical protein
MAAGLIRGDLRVQVDVEVELSGHATSVRLWRVTLD